MQTEELLQELMALPAEEREKVAVHLFASLEKQHRARIEALWAAEAEDRIDALDRGELELEDGETVMARLRNRR